MFEVLCYLVSYVDDCLDDADSSTHLTGDTDGYLAVFPQHLPTSRRCPWVLTVNTGRRINVTWRVSPTPQRYIPPGISLPIEGRGNPRVDQTPCSFRLTFIESGHEPVQWTCRHQNTVPVDHSVQVQFSVPFLVLVPTAICITTPAKARFPLPEFTARVHGPS